MGRGGDSLRICFVSCNEAAWGGSEELWAGTALAAIRAGHRVSALKPHLDLRQPPLKALGEAGCRLRNLTHIPLSSTRAYAALTRVSRTLAILYQLLRLWLALRRDRPDLVVLSQGGNWDGFAYAKVCQKLKLRYILVSQKASDIHWPPDAYHSHCRTLHERAEATFFVSRHNLRLTEEQLAITLPQADVVRNPFLVDYAAPLAWPGDDGVTRLACIGRLYPMEKGQDVLLRVLARPKWRERPLHVDFYGTGTGQVALEEMARYLKLENVTFHGHVDDIPAVWQSHHGLVLPSRCEGLPLVLVECMLVGRIAITTDVGGSAEVLDDNTTGFLASAPTEAAFDDAMERAWMRRSDWSTIARTAATAIRDQVPADPSAALMQKIADLTTRLAGQSRKEAARLQTAGPTG